MDKLIVKFIEQLRQGLEIGRAAEISTHKHTLQKIFVSGMGGSGIGGDFVASFIKNEAGIPMSSGKGYDIPAFVDRNTLAIVSSYSGNTEETLSAFEKLLKTGAKMVCVTAGGKLLQLAKEHGLDFVLLPGNWPAPRACLGFSMVAQLAVLVKLKLVSESNLTEIEKAIVLLEKESTAIRREAKKIAERLLGKIPVIYGNGNMEAVLIRFRQQLNENAKTLAWHHVIPEMNHNELVGWAGQYPELAVVFIRNEDDAPKIKRRMEINKEILYQHTDTMIEIESRGNTLIERSVYLIHIVDWVSWYLAELKQIDAMEIEVIDYLKEQLAATKNE